MLNWRDLRHIFLLTFFLIGVVVAGLVSYLSGSGLLARYSINQSESEEVVSQFQPQQPVLLIANPVLNITQPIVNVLELAPYAPALNLVSGVPLGEPLPFGVCGLTLPCVP